MRGNRVITFVPGEDLLAGIELLAETQRITRSNLIRGALVAHLSAHGIVLDSEDMPTQHKSDGWRARHSARMRELWASEEYRQKHGRRRK